MTVVLWIAIFLLSVISACTVLMTYFFFSASQDLRRIVPPCNQTFQEARRTLGMAHQLLTRIDQTAQQVEEVVDVGCDTASGIFHQIAVMNGKARAFLKKRLGNGARVSSRPSHR